MQERAYFRARLEHPKELRFLQRAAIFSGGNENDKGGTTSTKS